MITKQPETGFQGKNVIWEAADIPVIFSQEQFYVYPAVWILWGQRLLWHRVGLKPRKVNDHTELKKGKKYFNY